MPVNPYQRLQEACRKWAISVLHPRQVVSLTLERARHVENFNLSGLWERIRTAEQCGYDCILITNGDSIVMELRKRPDPAPWELKL